MHVFRTFLIASLFACGACGDDPVCGPVDDAGETLRSVNLADEEIMWQDFRSSPNNDCGEAGGPVSLTLEAKPSGQSQNSLVLCLPRPDKISGKVIEVGDSTRLQIIDLFVTPPGGGDCLAGLDRARPASGSVAFHGVCDDGLASEGYSLDVDMSVPISILCGEDLSNDELRFAGSVRVSAQ